MEETLAELAAEIAKVENFAHGAVGISIALLFLLLLYASDIKKLEKQVRRLERKVKDLEEGS